MSWRHLSTKEHKARADYRCDLCGTTIEKGTLYTRHIGVDDGEFYNGEFHLECYDFAEANMDPWDDRFPCCGSVTREEVRQWQAKT